MKQNEQLKDEVTPQQAVAIFADRLIEKMNFKAQHCDFMADARYATGSQDGKATAGRFEAKSNAYADIVRVIQETAENLTAELDIVCDAEVKS